MKIENFTKEHDHIRYIALVHQGSINLREAEVLMRTFPVLAEPEQAKASEGSVSIQAVSWAKFQEIRYNILHKGAELDRGDCTLRKETMDLMTFKFRKTGEKFRYFIDPFMA